MALMLLSIVYCVQSSSKVPNLRNVVKLFDSLQAVTRRPFLPCSFLVSRTTPCSPRSAKLKLLLLKPPIFLLSQGLSIHHSVNIALADELVIVFALARG